jgi:hypothetical protein
MDVRKYYLVALKILLLLSSEGRWKGWMKKQRYSVVNME